MSALSLRPFYLFVVPPGERDSKLPQAAGGARKENQPAAKTPSDPGLSQNGLNRAQRLVGLYTARFAAPPLIVSHLAAASVQTAAALVGQYPQVTYIQSSLLGMPPADREKATPTKLHELALKCLNQIALLAIAADAKPTSVVVAFTDEGVAAALRRMSQVQDYHIPPITEAEIDVAGLGDRAYMYCFDPGAHRFQEVELNQQHNAASH